MAAVTWSSDEASVQVDAYLDGLLALRAAPASAAEPLAADLVRAAEAVRDALVRVHPSFRFEEALAGRLRALARGGSAASEVMPFPPAMHHDPVGGRADEPADDPVDGRSDGRAPAVERGWVLLGGVIASGVSLVAGVAGVVLARRRTRGDRPLERLA